MTAVGSPLTPRRLDFLEPVAIPADAKSRREIRALSLRLNVSFSALSRLTSILSQGAILVLIAQFGDVDMLGRFALAVSVVAPVMMLSNLELRSLYATETGNAIRFADYFGLRLATCSLALFLCCGIGVMGPFDRGTQFAITAVAVFRVAEAIGDALHGLFQRHERYDRVAVSSVAKAALSVIAFGITLAASADLILALLAGAAAHLITLFVYDLPSSRGITNVLPRFTLARLFRLAKLGLPLGVTAVLFSLASNIPRYVLADIHGNQALGKFAVGSYFFLAVTAATVAVQQATSPRLAQKFRAGRGEFLGFLGILLCVAVGWGGFSIMAAILFGETVLVTLFGESFSDCNTVLVWLMVVSLIVNIRCFLRAGLTVMRVTNRQAILSAIQLLVAAILAFSVVPAYGAQGVAWTLLGTAMTGLILTACVVWHQLRTS